ncbi:hypothetical protein KAFR_0G02790 [Kazachstania africana CBS 2517]|uniref:Calponin-homology (CH) domain-containing protein n=1 Tax=Kazachstania africana (strain ATCC 22294 / BCRC 22015 / CBS 2517 / CECT 1963 / NBRC 1671 / NRRL Y-8276) TaxID=1071382 RepID=H2AY60_KAZAF|nr:hypothetical protein KAFR_0G02790 [Kazachstania africana CBS 2517]CCF59310.1 hypothetical protein KAFR_0G02790 [Kazachstania africana CBS 2517]
MSSNLGESRTDLLNWLNELLRLNYKKVEECGTGAAYCQILDSIYGDIPMHRVKFDATAEYEFYTNYKILQSCFARHHIEKTVNVERLVKCRFQDNLEFLQWIKKHWVQNKDSSDYDAESRRKYRRVSGGISTSTSSASSSNTSIASGNGISVTKRRNNGLGSQSTTSSMRSSYTNNRKVSNEQLLATQAELTQLKTQVSNLNQNIDQFKETTNVLERERDFYFGKLRDIEILVQSTSDLISEGVYTNGQTDELDRFLNKVQQILYATEESTFGSNNIDIEVETKQTQELPVTDLPDQKSYIDNDDISVKPALPTQNLIIDDETF